MTRRLPALLLAPVLALTGVAPVLAQSASDADSTVLPVLNRSNGKVEALLLLEPAKGTASVARWRFGGGALDARFGVQAGSTLGLVCNQTNGMFSAISSLSGNCMLATLGNQAGSRVNAGVGFDRNNYRVGATLGSGHSGLPNWLAPAAAGSQISQNDLSIYGQRSFGRDGFVTIGGSLARARLLPVGAMPSAWSEQWNSRSVSIGGGIGSFSANIVGRVVDVPGQPSNFESLGVGINWRTPWSGQLSVGAENIITRGRNPFAPGTVADGKGEGTVPYVRYEQDL
jgi:hypothetical protein